MSVMVPSGTSALTECVLWVGPLWAGGSGGVGVGLWVLSRQRRVAVSRYPFMTGDPFLVTVMLAAVSRISQPLSQRTGMEMMLCFTLSNV
jgi:hypothetical protein